MKAPRYIGVAAVVVLLFILSTAVYTVNQTEQALVLYFGEPVGVVTDAGLHFKEPLVESIVYLDNRILDLETPQQEVLVSDNQRVLVDAFVRYHIDDPLKFYQTVGSVSRANNQLASVLNSALRRVLGEATLPQIVRDERAQLMVKIRDLVNTEGARLGVAVNDVRIRRADLPRELSESIYSRMQSERAREAAEYRAQGSEQSQTIQAKANRDVVVIKAEAQKQADMLRGAGDAERNRIFAEAYGKDPVFFSFYRTMQAYVSSLRPDHTRLVLSPSSDFFRYFQSPDAPAPADLKSATPSAASPAAAAPAPASAAPSAGSPAPASSPPAPTP
ncbi:MAG TPA: protease modulator HflC [Lichenihabitans sp.]|jgi:membrane protease subunit HflC|nr:protease modulator HflC [Lichenihabitans sp.]